MTLAADILSVRLAAELALLERVSVGAADPRAPVVAYLRDPDARARLHHGTLRPDGSHRRQLDDVRAKLRSATAAPSPRLAALASRAGLSPAAVELLAIAAAYDLDLDARELLHALAPRRRPGLWLEAVAEIGVARAAHLASPADALAAARTVAHLLDVDGDGLATTLGLRPAARAWLLGDDAWPEPTMLIADPTDPAEHARVAIPAALRARLAGLVDGLRTDGAVVVLRGARGSGRRAAAQLLAAALDRPLLTIDARRLLRAAGTGPVAPLLADALAGATWRGALVLLLEIEALLDTGGQLALAVEQLLRQHRGALLLATAASGAPDLGRTVHDVALGRATLDEREAAWRHALAPHADATTWAPELAARYVLGAGAIAGVVVAAERTAITGLDLAHLEATAASRLSLRLGAFGTVIARKARFTELVLPDDTVDTLHDMVAMVGSRAQILERWDFGRHLGIARGVSALFSGDPGTGKTMAASVLASALGLELVRIDLAAVVSKYVGETEKNLAAIFDEAQDAHAMLLFDEADGLFAKRTEVKSAQDRFANLEVGYLLQRMETFDGVSVLTTNLEASIDAALLRRLNFRVRFPTPEPDERERLWRQLVPPAAIGGATFEVRPLAEAFAMSGGYIKNAIVRAGVVAARAGRLVSLDDLWTGAHAEYAEMGKVTSSLQRPV